MPSVTPALIPTAAALGPRPPVAPAHAEATAALPAEVYLIGCGTDAASAAQATVQTMGFKAWNLLRMAQMSLPVPPAFVLGTHYCVDPAARELASSPDLWQAGLRALERATGLALGSARQPLLLSVRSGAPVSMPGMMETILNVGLCDATVGGLLRHTGNPRLVWDAYRRLVATYGEVVAGLPAQLFDEASTDAGRREAMNATSTSRSCGNSRIDCSMSMRSQQAGRFRKNPVCNLQVRSVQSSPPGSPPRRASIDA